MFPYITARVDSGPQHRQARRLGKHRLRHRVHLFVDTFVRRAKPAQVIANGGAASGSHRLMRCGRDDDGQQRLLADRHDEPLTMDVQERGVPIAQDVAPGRIHQSDVGRLNVIRERLGAADDRMTTIRKSPPSRGWTVATHPLQEVDLLPRPARSPRQGSRAPRPAPRPACSPPAALRPSR